MHEAWIHHLEGLARLRAGHADVWCSLGQALHLGGRAAEALSALDRALALNPGYLEAGIERCFALEALGRAGEAFAAFRPVLAAAPDDPAPVLGLGVLCMRAGFAGDGLGQLRRAASLAPRRAFVALLHAAALEQAGDGEGATAERRRGAELLTLLPAAVSIEPGFLARWPLPGLARAHAQHAHYLLQCGDRAGAERELRRASARFPGHPLVVVETGRVQALLDRPQEAQRWLRAAIAIEATSPAAHLELSFLHAERGDLDAAVECLRQAVELRPMYPDYRYHLGTLLLDLGRGEEAVQQLERALLLEPEHGHCALRLALAHLGQQRLAAARTVLESGPWREWPEALVLAAEACARDGQPEEARRRLERVLERDPGHAQAAAALARLAG